MRVRDCSWASGQPQKTGNMQLLWHHQDKTGWWNAVWALLGLSLHAGLSRTLPKLLDNSLAPTPILSLHPAIIPVTLNIHVNNLTNVLTSASSTPWVSSPLHASCPASLPSTHSSALPCLSLECPFDDDNCLLVFSPTASNGLLWCKLNSLAAKTLYFSGSPSSYWSFLSSPWLSNPLYHLEIAFSFT